MTTSNSDKTSRCRGPLSRRSLLQAGAVALSGLGLTDLMRLRAESAALPGADSDTSVIFIWLPGGPPHMETYDMKPQAPLDYRGDFSPIPTVVPGMEICEHLPLHARVADKFSLIRSISHAHAGHGDGMKHILTARDPGTPEDFVTISPMVGSVVAKIRQKRNLGVPNYVAGTDAGREPVDTYGFGSAYLGTEMHPFFVVGDPNAPKFEVKNLSLAREMEGRLNDRTALLAGLDRIRRDVDTRGSMHALDEFNQRALQLLSSNKTRDAFDLSQEPAALRDRYGRHPWGQRAIMARRLVEAGVSFVTMVMENCTPPGQPAPKETVYNWDSHSVNCHLFKDALYRLPVYDQAITALIEDLYQRGLDKKVLLVVTGEFGRTPRITSQIGTQTGVMQPGRDHWPSAMSVLVSGGGLRMGQVVGSTNSKGEVPKDRPLTPQDLWATVYQHLGIDYNQTSFPDFRGRPMPILPSGAPISELL
ncbi:MAG: hypothetical protein JWM11_6096 [Planctomycetaceae bacterium]|nr:hypothetical protein [Planctomycetaceae bacterium]